MARGETTGKKPRATRDHDKREDGPPKEADPKAIEPQAQSDQTKGESNEPKRVRGPPPAFAQAFTIDEFCEAHRISREFFFKMQRDGWGPVVMQVGSRRLISQEAATNWRRQREQAAA
jgi:hypothetical protein